MKALTTIREAVKKRPEELSEARSKGQIVVGYFCCYIPEEIILALGMIPIRLGRGGDENLVGLGSEYVSDKNCVFIRESMGLFAEGRDPFVVNSDIVAVAGTCVQMYRMAEVVEYYFKPKKVAILGVPRNFYLPEGRTYFREEMKDFVRQLEEISETKLVQHDLETSIKLCQEIRDAVLELYDYQAIDCPPISWEEILEVIHAGFYLDRNLYLSFLKKLLTEVKDRDIAGKPDDRIRLMLSGSIIAPDDWKIIRLVAEMGGRIVADDLCTGLRFHKELVVKDNSIASIADANLDRIPCASLPCLLPIDEDRRFIHMLQMIQDCRVEGMLYHTLRFCDPFTFKAPATKKFLQEQFNLPFLELHTEYSTSDIEAIRTRLESFMDTLRTRRLENGVLKC